MKASKLAPYIGALVRVVWLDACGNSEWQTEQEACALQLSRITSVGTMLALVSDGLPERVVLASDRDEDGNVNGVSVVPAGWVVSCERLG